jgi:ABC-2 type transport system ATP-binding protein
MSIVNESLQPVVQIDGLVIQYGRAKAVDNVTLHLRKGESLGLLGANGAGKTSSLKALMGMMRPQRGTVRVFGSAPGTPSVLKRVGFAPEDALPPDRCSGAEYLDFVAQVRRLSSDEARKETTGLLEDFDLAPHKLVRDYSKGMKRRLVLAQAFVGRPELMVLDEPLNGLDPLIIVSLRNRLEKYRLAGGTLLYSSHILAEVEKSCTRIFVLRSGRAVLDSPLSDVLAQYGSVERAFESVSARES